MIIRRICDILVVLLSLLGYLYCWLPGLTSSPQPKALLAFMIRINHARTQQGDYPKTPQEAIAAARQYQLPKTGADAITFDERTGAIVFTYSKSCVEIQYRYVSAERFPDLVWKERKGLFGKAKDALHDVPTPLIVAAIIAGDLAYLLLRRKLPPKAARPASGS